MNSIKFNKRIGGKKQLGQGMTEYIIIVALIAVAAIGFYSAFGHTLTKNVASVTNSVAGRQGAANGDLTAAGQIATAAETKSTTQIGMDNYTTNNQNQ